MQRSFVVSIDNERLNAFYKNLSMNGFQSNLFPKHFIGYEISDKYLVDNFKELSDLRFSNIHGPFEERLKLIHSLCNNASHFAIVQYAKLLDWSFVTIFEDDAVPENNCIEKLREYCSNILDDIDVLRIGYLIDHHKIREKDYIPPKIVHDHFIVETFGGSHAYIVFKKYYERFLKDNKFQPRCDFDKINPSSDKIVYSLKESLFKQENIPDRPVIHSWKLKDGKIKLPIVH
jgi:hypothetical protein